MIILSSDWCFLKGMLKFDFLTEGEDVLSFASSSWRRNLASARYKARIVFFASGRRYWRSVMRLFFYWVFPKDAEI